jgi:hypothetical protein
MLAAVAGAAAEGDFTERAAKTALKKKARPLNPAFAMEGGGI